MGGCEGFVPEQQLCYYAIEKKWKTKTPQTPTEQLLQKLTQGHMDQQGNFYLDDGTKITDAFIDQLPLDDYHKNILKIISAASK